MVCFSNFAAFDHSNVVSHSRALSTSAIGWSISDGDLAEIDAIFERHEVNPVPDYWIEDA